MLIGLHIVELDFRLCSVLPGSVNKGEVMCSILSCYEAAYSSLLWLLYTLFTF